MSDLECVGWFNVFCWENGKLAWREVVPNMATTVGKNYMLNAAFRGSAQLSSWYSGLVAYASGVAFAEGDTMSSHAGWTENTAYSEGTRPQWSAAAAAGSSMTAPTYTFTVNASGQALHGLFVNSDSTKGGTTGTLWATGAFSTTKRPNNGAVLQCVYTTTLKSS